MLLRYHYEEIAEENESATDFIRIVKSPITTLVRQGDSSCARYLLGKLRMANVDGL